MRNEGAKVTSRILIVFHHIDKPLNALLDAKTFPGTSTKHMVVTVVLKDVPVHYLTSKHLRADSFGGVLLVCKN